MTAAWTTLRVPNIRPKIGSCRQSRRFQIKLIGESLTPLLWEESPAPYQFGPVEVDNLEVPAFEVETLPDVGQAGPN